MYVRKTYHDDLASDGSLAGGASSTPAPSPDASAAAPSPAPADSASAAPAAQPGSLLARGAADAADGSATAAAPAGPADGVSAIPEKYLVKNEDGTTNWEASALKQAQGYQHLSQRLGSDAPPKSPEEYAPELPAGVTLDALKSDPMYAGFLKGAHSKGMTNAQVGYVVAEFAQRMQLAEQMRNSPEVGEAELRKVWQTDQQMQQGLGQSYRAAKTFSQDEGHMQRLDAKFGNDPDYIQLMARIGKELGEDSPPGGITPVESETRAQLMASPAYLDNKHPEHKATVAKVRMLYEKQHAGQ
ncbi:hypothetical protein [Roseateles sp. PN1]|uniref:hypothetical protein n=1 Tax=Roseateles sp. PN1 TaxID=3137372 RepID=UPI00313919E8